MSAGVTFITHTLPHTASFVRPLLLALPLALLAACDAATFAPDGESYRDDVSPPQTGISVDLAGGSDTLQVWGDVELRYTVDLDGKPFRFAELYLDGELLETKGRMEPFELDTEDLSDGLHTLGLVVYAGAATGSLADALDAEVVYAVAERPALVDNAPVTPVEILSVGPENGRMAIRWERYTRPGFERYILSGNHGDFSFSTQDRAVTVAYDDAYVGGEEASYRLIVQAAGEQATPSWAGHADPGAALTAAERLGDYAVRLAWRPSPFYANVAAYRLERRRTWDESDWSPVLVSASDTSFTDELPERLGQEYVYRLTVERDGLYDIEAGAQVVRTGTVPPFFSPLYLQATDAVIGVRGDEIVRVRPGSDEVAAAAPYPGHPFATRDGARLFAADGPLLHELDPQSLQIVATLDLRPLYGSDVVAGSPVAGDGGRILLSYVRGVQGGLGVLAVDFDRGVSLARLSGGGRRLGPVSPSGRYAIVHGSAEGFGGDLYELTDTGFVRRRGGFGRYPTFLDDERILALAGAGGALYTVPTGDLLVEYATDAGGPPACDAASGLCAGVTASDLPDVVVFDPETGAERARLPISSDLGSPASFAFVDRAIWVTGAYQRLDLP